MPFDPISLTLIGAAVTKVAVGAKVAVPVAKGGVPAAKAAVSLGKFLVSVCKGVSAGSTASAQTGIAAGQAVLGGVGDAIDQYNKHTCFPPGPTGKPGICARIPV